MKKIKFVTLLLGLYIISFNSLASPPASDTVVVDNNRNLQVSENTQVTIDRRVVDTAQQRALEQFGTGFYSRMLPGFKARLNYQIGNNPTDNGELIDINLMNSVVGPVTLNDSTGFKVLTINLVLDADTVIEGADSIADINLGDTIAVSGLETEDGDLRVTRLEVLHNGSEYWLITGAVANLATDGFDLNQQHIITEEATAILCDTDLANDDKVIVDFEALNSYSLGDSLTAQTVICYEDIGNPGNPNAVFFNGDIQQVNADQTQIVVDGKTVNITAETNISSETNSTALEVGTNVSIDGILDANTNEIAAVFIFIHDSDGNPPGLPVILFGNAMNVTADSFEVEGQSINLDPATIYIDGVAADLIDGVIVQVTAESSQGGVLLALEIAFFNDSPNDEYFSGAGTISGLNADHTQFNLGNEIVELNPATQYFGTDQQSIADGMQVQIDGFRDSISNHIVADFLASYPENPGGHVCVSGTVQNINADQSQFTLDNGTVVNVTVDTQYLGGTQADLIVGANISISGLTNDTDDEIEAEAIFFDDGGTPPDYVFFRDFITDVSADGNQITVGTNSVNLTENTQIIGGSRSDLVVGIEVQVEGLVNTDGSITADSITLPLTMVSAFAPVLPADVIQSNTDANDGSITVMGIEFKQNDLSFDPLGVFVNGITDESDISVFGYQDSNGVNWAGFIYVVERGPGTPNNPTGSPMYFVTGQVSNLENDGLKILGVTIGNLDNAIFLDENSQQVTASDFIASLTLGDSISATDAESYDRATNTLNAGTVFKQAPQGNGHPGNKKHDQNSISATKSVSGSGIITQVITDVLFRSGF